MLYLLCILFDFCLCAERMDDRAEDDIEHDEPNTDGERGSFGGFFDREIQEPLYLSHYTPIRFSTLIYACILGAILAFMNMPIPLLNRFKKTGTLCIGVFLTTVHLLSNYYLFPDFMIWITAYILAGLTVLCMFSDKMSRITLSIVGAYVFTYLGFGLFGFNKMYLFTLSIISLCIGFMVFGIIMKTVHYLIIKSGTSTLLAVLIMNLITPLKPLGVFHGSGWAIFQTTQEILARAVILLCFVVFIVMDVFFDQRGGESKDKKDEEE